MKKSPKTPDTPSEKPKSEKKHKPTLFEDENDDEEEFTGNFEIKEQFQGEKGKRLMKLQNRYQGDSRFKLDAKFMDDENEDNEEDGGQAYELDNEESHPNNDEDDERKWQYNILEGVIGRNLDTASRDSKKK